jgi:alpha-beta hydrolase superfamily lysophospholipase
MPMTKKSYAKLDRPEILKILFHPRPDNGGEPPAGAIDHNFTMEGNVVVGARFYLASLEAPNILFFHGNGEIASDYDQAGPMYNALDMSFMVVDYRGYGRSSGEPAVTAMMRDGHVIFRETLAWLARENRTGPLLLMGRSLGSACAIDLAAAHQDDITGLIIESGFATTMPLLQALGIDVAAMGITEQDGFMNAAKIERITKPTYILHARYDQLIPVTNAEILQAQSGARRKEFHMVPGADHNSIMAVTGRLYFEAIRGFINKILGIKPRRRRR